MHNIIWVNLWEQLGWWTVEFISFVGMLDYASIRKELDELDPKGNEESTGLYADDLATQKEKLEESPWTTDPEYFKKVRISSLALVRMALHAKRGGSQEVMGVMTGKIRDKEFVVMDCYPLPVEATETRVNAMGEAYEYMVQYLESLQEVGRNENIVGWYHSHPGYGCWLSRIDVGTQVQSQQFQDPFLAIVIDPNSTMAAGKVDIGAFRTLPTDGRQMNERRNPTSATSTDPRKRDYGLYADMYYPLEINYFRSPLDEALFDLVWNRYWTSLLADVDLAGNSENAAGKMAEIAQSLQAASMMSQDDAGARSKHATAGEGRSPLKNVGQGLAAKSSKAQSLVEVSQELDHVAVEDIVRLLTIQSANAVQDTAPNTDTK